LFEPKVLKGKSVGVCVETNNYFSRGIIIQQILGKISRVKMSISEEYKSAQLMFDSFAAMKKEKLSDLIDRFISVASNIKKHDPELTNHEQIQRVLESLLPEWSLHVKILRKREYYQITSCWM